MHAQFSSTNWFAPIYLLQGFGGADARRRLYTKPIGWFEFAVDGWRVVDLDFRVLAKEPWSGIERIQSSSFMMYPSAEIVLGRGKVVGITTVDHTSATGRWECSLPGGPSNSFLSAMGGGAFERANAAIKQIQLADEEDMGEVSITPPGTANSAFAATWLGGHGLEREPTTSQLVPVLLGRSGVFVADNYLPYSELIDISVGGEGIYTTGGGWWGGGIGLGGALKGAAMASVLNSLTTRTHVETIVRMIFEHAEINLLLNTVAPDEFDITLSPLRSVVRNRATRETKSSRVETSSEGGFCENCGLSRNKTALFCGKCGAKF